MKYLLLFLVFLVSCSKNPSTPEGLIEMYVDDLTTKGASKDYFEKYTAGKLWESVAELSEEDFSKFVNMKKIKNAKINILNKNCASKNACLLTYVVKYDVNNKTKKEFKSEIKKIAKLEKVEGKWKIFEVTNIKTYFDSVTPIEVLK